MLKDARQACNTPVCQRALHTKAAAPAQAMPPNMTCASCVTHGINRAVQAVGRLCRHNAFGWLPYTMCCGQLLQSIDVY